MLKLRAGGRLLMNTLAAPLGARLVGAGWGPRGIQAALLRAKRQGFAPATILDIGASNGQWTRECRRVFPQARCFLADPLPENAAALRRLARKNTRITVWNGAIGAAPGRLDIFSHGDQSSFLPSADFRGTPQAVEVRTLDSFIAEAAFAAPMLLKADTQGFELEVLQGAQECLRSTEMLLLEVSFRRVYDGGPLAHEVIGYAGSIGFRIWDICTYTQRPGDGELVHADLLFVREGSSLLADEGWH